MRRRITALATAVLLTAAAGSGIVAGTSAPAAAAACSGQSGVTVVVDRGSLGGGIAQVCNPSRGGNAAALVTGAGFSLTYVQRQPGFVCRVDGLPASDPCVNTPPADAYWGLWWSDGSSGTWTYSSLGAGSLSVPEGGYVGFAWQSGSKSAPGVPATPHSSAPSPTPTQAPSSSPSTGGGGSGSATPTRKPTPSPTPKPTPKPPKPTAKPSAQPTSLPSSATPTAVPTVTGSADAATVAPGQGETSAAAEPTESPTVQPASPPDTAAAPPSGSASFQPGDSTTEVAPTSEGGALPAWVVPLVIVLLAAGGGAAYLLRRRTRPSP